MQAVAGLVESGHIQKGLAIGTDTAQSKPHDALEYTSASAGVAFILGSEKPAVTLESYTSYSSDTPDFWRRDGSRFPTHAGRFTGEPAYFAHVIGASQLLLQQSHVKPGDVTYCVFHMPNARFPRDVARRLGFTPVQLAPSLTVDLIGNPYAASSLLGLAAVLDQAKPGDTIFMVSYGSGAGSDGFLWKVNDGIMISRTAPRSKQLVHQQIENKTYIDYGVSEANAQDLKHMNVYIIGAATTKFGELWGVSPGACKTSGEWCACGCRFEAGDIEHYLWEICSPVCWEVRNIWGVFAEELGLSVPAFKIEGACASEARPSQCGQ